MFARRVARGYPLSPLVPARRAPPPQCASTAPCALTPTPPLPLALPLPPRLMPPQRGHRLEHRFEDARRHFFRLPHARNVDEAVAGHERFGARVDRDEPLLK